MQPSEFAKLALIAGLAVILQGSPRARARPNAGAGGLGQLQAPVVDRFVTRPGPSRFGLCLALLGVLTVLVLAQGESGTVLVYCAIALGMMTAAGVQARYLLLLAVSGVAVIGLALSAGVLAPYQVDRFEAFLDADLDPQGVGYNQQQALTAIGSGGLRGAGLFDGPQTQLGYLPDQHTDFIFSAVAEELGFVGAAVVLALEAAILGFVFLIGNDSRDRFGQLLCAGVFSFLAFQVLQNVAMNLRLMPITGISLPFVSYGGSSLLSSLLAIGLVQSVAVHRGSHPRTRHRRRERESGLL
jgi:rod shape determining protein RodA